MRRAPHCTRGAFSEATGKGFAMSNKSIARHINALSLILLVSFFLPSYAGAAGRMTEAALKGDAKAMDKMLQRDPEEINAGAPVKKLQAACPGESILTPLQAASCAGHAAIAAKLLDSGAVPDLQTSTGTTALLLAVSNGKDDIARILVERGANPDLAGADGNTPLILSVKRANVPLVEFLLKSGASPRNRNRDGETALMLASNANMAKMLLDAGADPMQKNNRGESAMLIGARSGDAATSALFRDLQDDLRKAVDKEMEGGDLAAEKGSLDEARTLYSAAIGKSSSLGETAVKNARIRMLKKVNSLPEPPPLSEKAREHLVRSSYVLKNSQNLEQAEKELAAALDADPWWLEGYHNIGVLQAKLNRFDLAEENLAIYVAAASPGTQTQSAQDKIYEIGMAREEAGKILGMTGSWVDGTGQTYRVTVNGSSVRIAAPAGLAFSLTIDKNTLKGSAEAGTSAGPHGCTLPGQIHPVNGRIDPDANGMSLEYLWSSYDAKFHYVNMFGAPVTGNCLTCSKKCDGVTINATNTVSLRLSRSGGSQAGGTLAGERATIRSARGR